MATKNLSINPQLTSAQLMDDFVRSLLEESGMDDVSPEVKEQMSLSLKARLNDRLFATVLMNLPEDKVTKLREMTESGEAGEGLQKFIDTNLPNASELFSQAMLGFRNDYLGLA